MSLTNSGKQSIIIEDKIVSKFDQLSESSRIPRNFNDQLSEFSNNNNNEKGKINMGSSPYTYTRYNIFNKSKKTNRSEVNKVEINKTEIYNSDRREESETEMDNESNNMISPFSKIRPKKYKNITNRTINYGKYQTPKLKLCIDVEKINLKIPRAGSIFYINQKGETYICLGRDLKSNELTDFGGQIEKYGETILQCAVRESN